MAKKLKELHLAQNIGELNKQAEVTVSFNLPPEKMFASMEKAFESAKHDEDTGDEEYAYIKYMRVVSLGTKVMRTKSSSDRVNRLLPKKLNDALIRAEALNKSLSKRYGFREEERRRALQEQQEREQERQRTAQQQSPIVTSNGVVDGPDDLASIDSDGDMDEILSEAAASSLPVTVTNYGTITCKLLSRYVANYSDYSFLVLDCRPKNDFLASHVQHEWVVNVPSDSIQPGMTAHAVEGILPDVSRSRWQKRHDVEMLVLMDWGSDPPENPIHPKLGALLNALKLDGGKSYRSRVLILQGGFESWHAQFPQLTTNPSVVKPVEPSVATSTVTSSNGISSMSVSVTDFPWKLSKKSPPPVAPSSASAASDDESKTSRTSSFYPRLDGLSFAFKKRTTEETDVGFHRKRGHHSPHAPPEVNRSTKPAFVERVFGKKEKIANGSSIPPNSSVTSLDSVKPAIDRNKKPPELVANLAEAKREAERIDDEYMAEMRRVEEKERELQRLEQERRSSWKEKEHLEKEAKLLERLKESEDARTRLAEEMEVNRCELESLRAKLLASGESVANEESPSEQRKAAEKRNLELEVKRLREERKEKERRRRDEEDRRKREADMEVLRERQRKIEEEKRKKQEAEEARIRAELAAQKRKEEEENARVERERREEERRKKLASEEKRTIYHEPLKETVGGGGGLTRSHSSPNIDQLGIASPDRSSATSMPGVDRQLKKKEFFERDPFLCRRRNFAEVHGTTVPGQTGLKNLGNTCYMNATIQCLGSAPFLTKYFIDQSFLDDLNVNCDTKGEMARELYLVLRHLWSGRYRNIAIYDFKELVGKYYFMFRGHDQQDCHEFLVTLLAWLRDDVNRVKVKKRSVNLDIDRIPEDIEAAKVAWEALVSTEQSIFTDSFGGLQKSTLLCQNCDHVSRTFEPIFELSLPLPSKNRCSLEECIREYLNGERLADRVCPQCHRKGFTIKKFHVWKFPHILIIHLKRFEKGGGRLEKKLQNYVDFQLDGLDLSEFSTAPAGAAVPTSSSPMKFDLFAVTNHYGTMDGGHYTAYCRNRGKTWCKYDDQSVREMSPGDVKSSAAYVLYFAERHLMKSSCYPTM